MRHALLCTRHALLSRKLGHVMRRQSTPEGAARPPDDITVSREAWRLPGDSLHTPRRARSAAASTCRGWGLPADTTDNLTLIVSELTTNAVIHAPGASVFVSLVLTAGAVHVIVIDQGCGDTPDGPSADSDRDGGRGLELVQALAGQFAVMPVREGMLVCASLSLTDEPQPRLPTLGPLPDSAGKQHSVTH